MSISLSTREERALISWHKIPNLQCDVVSPNTHAPLRQNATLTFAAAFVGDCRFACVSVAETKLHHHFSPTPSQLLKHPLAVLALMPRDAALLPTGAAAKTFTAPLDRIKLLMQTHECGLGKIVLRRQSVLLSLRLAVEPGCRTMSEVALIMLSEVGFVSFYRGLGPSLIAIAPYITVNFCVFDLLKKSLPEKYQKRTETSILTVVLAASLATLTRYPLDTVRRQMQLRGTPYKTILDAFSGIVARDVCGNSLAHLLAVMIIIQMPMFQYLLAENFVDFFFE